MNRPPLICTVTDTSPMAWRPGVMAWTLFSRSLAETPMARLLRPWQDLVREKLHVLGEKLDPGKRRRAWYHLTNSYNSDGQWPPTLPDAPHIVHPFNYGYCFENLLAAELLVDGVDRGRLSVDPAATVREILGPQQGLVAEKAQAQISSADAGEAESGRLAMALIEESRRTEGLQGTALYPADYKVRADALAEARRLVGGVTIERVGREMDRGSLSQ